MRFVKMHSVGNDFVILDAFEPEVRAALPAPADLGATAKAMCDRHLGIGADGVLILEPSGDAGTDALMTIVNADGSMGAMCANGLRAAARLLTERDRIDATRPVRIRIHDRIVPLTITRAKSGAFAWAEADMGSPILDLAKIPVDSAHLDAPPVAGSPTIRVMGIDLVPVSMGNPHAIVISEDPERDMRRLGSTLENHPAFPERTNVHFMRIRSREAAMLFSWERGVGHTLGCGSGACAAMVAGTLLGVLNPQASMIAPGGTLSVRFDRSANRLFLTGGASTVFEGEWASAPVAYSKRSHARPSTPDAIPELRTERLVLRQTTWDDASAHRAIVSPLAVAECVASVPHPYPPGEEHAFLSRITRWRDEKRGVGFAITLATTSELIGSVGVRFDSDDSGELGYLLGPDHWGKGYATEASRAVIDFCFQTLGLTTITAGHYQRNPASGNVLRKLGFVHIGEEICPCTARQSRETSLEYALARADWASRR